jgi:hypothetical protein
VCARSPSYRTPRVENSKGKAAAGAQPIVEVAVDGRFSEEARRKLERTATFLAKATKQAEADAPRTKLLDASELTEEDLRHVSKTEYFLPKSRTRFGSGPAGAASRSTCHH